METNLLIDTGTLMGVRREVDRLQAFLRDRYFTAWHFSKTPKIFWDTIVGKPRIAPYVHRKLPGKAVERRGFRTDSIEPAYVKPLTPIDPDEYFKRLPGEMFLGELTPAQRRLLTIPMIMADHEEMLTVAEEAQCAEGLLTGKVTIKGEGVDTVVDFRRHASLSEVLVGGADFATANFDVLAYVEARAQRVRTHGKVVVRDVIQDPVGWTAFFARLTEKQKEFLLNSQYGGQSRMELGPRLAEKLQYKGQLGDYVFWVYNDQYNDHEGVERDMLPEGSLILTGPALAGTRCYGAIQNIEAGFQSVRQFDTHIIERNPSRESILTEGAPLMTPYNVNASFGARTLG